MTLPTASRTHPHIDPVEEIVSVERIKQKTRTRRLQSVQALAERMQVAPDGARTFIRFSRAQCLEHQILMVTFTTLAVTGLLQRYSEFGPVRLLIGIFGNIDTLRTIHHLAAAVMILQSIYHVEQILVTWFVKRERGAMWPQLRDFRDLVQMVMFNLGLTKERPEFDRFSIEEKLEYWAMLWGTPVMIITGSIMWFPLIITKVVPGDVVPISRAIHGWEAILATLAILTWHMYHTAIKEKNRSVFDGTMTEEEMEHSHPREYQRILAAHEYLQKMRAGNSPTHSVNVTSKVDYETVQDPGQAN